MPQSPSAPQWPPRSAREALLSSPSGRERWREMAAKRNAHSPSPSPSRPRSSRATGQDEMEYDDDEDDDEDEETLQLQLQAIKAKLKLKKLQAKAAREGQALGSDADDSPFSRPKSAPLGGRQRSALADAGTEASRRPKSQAEVEVPASPVRRVLQDHIPQRSPVRERLGLDQRNAENVSLKRAPSLKSAHRREAASPLKRSRTPGVDQSKATEQAPRPLSFNERIASAKAEEITRNERLQRIRNVRTSAFSIGKEEMEQYKSGAIDLDDEPEVEQTYSREEVLGTNTGGLHRSNTAPSVRGESRLQHRYQAQESSGISSQTTAKTTDTPEPGEGVASFEPSSGLHLSKRILPHPVVARMTTGKKTYLIKDLLRDVKAPEFELPEVEADVVVFAIVASKSDPKSHKPVVDENGNEKKQQDRGKFMVITLCDLTYEVDLYLFGSGFDRFWKLTVGTVLAILNPSIMPPPRGREVTGRWALVLNSDADTVLEIGTARDLGHCASMRRDGTVCSAWVNGKRTAYCEFHTNQAIQKTRANRQAVNQMGFGDGRYKKSRQVFLQSKNDRQEQMRREDYDARSGRYDAETQSRYYVSTAQSASSIIDREGGIANHFERDEALKRKLAVKEKEREIARKLGEIGGGAGRDYMRLGTVNSKSGSTTSGGFGSSVSSSTTARSSTVASSQTAPNVTSSNTNSVLQDLLSRPKDARDVKLGPVKRKRPASTLSDSTAGGTRNSGAGSLGWGTTLKDKLARMKEGEKLKPVSSGSSSGAGASARERSPVRKKTRFITEKGIREAGRESLGAELSTGARHHRQIVDLPDDDDDGELIIE